VAPGKVVMEQTDAGFLRPRQDSGLTADEEARIARICPGLGQRVVAEGRRDDVLWGPYVSMRKGHAMDEEMRHTASSGGALSAILLHLLETGQVDGVIQTAASPDLPIGNVAVLSEDRAGILRSAGSRYAPSSPLGNLTDYLDGKRRYAFVGKPCDVVALRALAREDLRIDAEIPFVLSFFCAGVPSLKGAEAVVEKLGASLDEVTAFRYRGNGWPGHATATLASGEEKSMTYHASWGGVLSKHVQHRCKICADGTGKAADVVCADAWHADEDGYPLFEEEDGVSLVVARTNRGEALVEAATSAGAIALEPFDVAELPAIQPGQFGRRRALAARLLGLRLTGMPVPRYDGLNVRAAAKRNSLKGNLKNMLGMMRRVLMRRV
jgi:coenzyme F420 hydrogenase subunit beta